MRSHPGYGDLFNLDEWAEFVRCGAVTYDDGSGYWATATEYDEFADVFFQAKPTWATHVLWFNK